MLQAYQRSGREGSREFRRAQERSGVEPPDLPGPPLWFQWGPAIGEREAGAFFSVAAALEQAIGDWRRRYALRCGVESLISQASRRSDLHHARYRGLAKTRLRTC